MSIIHFGTDGIRGKANKFPFTTIPLHFLGKALVQWASQKYSRPPRVIIAHDTRKSYDRIKKNLHLGMSNAKVFDAQTLPTPAIMQIMAATGEFDLGIMISASHNPYYDNGIKVFDRNGVKITTDDEKLIETIFNKCITSQSTIEDLSLKDWSLEDWSLEDNVEKIIKYTLTESIYKKNILSYFKPGMLKDKTIVLDCANGATYKIAPEIFTELGANIVTIAKDPNGININDNCGALYPEKLSSMVLKYSAYAGFAFDGDGDRVIAVNRSGEIKDGDDLLSLLLKHPVLKNESAIIGTVMSNHGLDTYLKNKNIDLIRTRVGDKHISYMLEKSGFLLGGETSGHIIMRDYLNSGDGIFAALRVLETMQYTNNHDLNTFKKLPQVLVNVPVSKKEDLENEPYSKLINIYKNGLNNGRIIVRYSGTENVLRVMAEDIDKTNAQYIATTLAKKLQNALGD